MPMAEKTRIALIGIIVESPDSVEMMNHILSQYGDSIVGRMGIPYRQKDISVISVVVDAPQNLISSLSGKLGMLEGITAKTIYSSN